MWMEFIFEAILIAITGSFGIIGNISLTTWFANMDKKLHFHYLMITLAFFDTTYIVTCILVFSVPLYFEGETIKPYYYYIVPKAIPIAQIALTGSSYCTGAISVERYLTVCHPFYPSRKKWSAKRYRDAFRKKHNKEEAVLAASRKLDTLYQLFYFLYIYDKTALVLF